jgi:hypothetical protein
MDDTEEGKLGNRELIKRLAIVVLEFQPDADDVNDDRSYLVFNALMRYVEGLDLNQDGELLRRIFDFLESAAREGDDAVVRVVRDALWGLATWADVNLYKPLMGRKSRALLRDVNVA